MSIHLGAIGQGFGSAASWLTPVGRAEQRLDALQSLQRPSDIGLVQWERMSSAERLAATAGTQVVHLARAEVQGDSIVITPESDERSILPGVTVPNTADAGGFPNNRSMHSYLFSIMAPAEFVGPAGLADIEAALAGNPTPGLDRPATPLGTLNNVGSIPLALDNDTNFVRSHLIESDSPHHSDIVVNYTQRMEHALEEGYVMRFAELLPNGRVQLVTYGEGNSFAQWEVPLLGRIPDHAANAVWTNNANEIFQAALTSRYQP